MYTMSIRAILHKIRRVFTPPGNRGSLEESYRQPNGEGTQITSEAGAAKASQQGWGV
jgi:hypothetical protein